VEDGIVLSVGSNTENVIGHGGAQAARRRRKRKSKTAMKLDAYDSARSAIAKTGFTAAVQSKISLFLIAVKNVNAMFLGGFELQPFVGVAHQFLHMQYFHEVEAVVLLTKVTRWTTDPNVYAEAFRITTPIVQSSQPPGGMPPANPADPYHFCRGLALGHAILSQVRLSPIIPADFDETNQFVVALRRLEQDGARMIQTQINLLRAVSSSMPDGDVDALIEEKQEVVQTAFSELLHWLAQPRTA
jgi:hypothetical protein